MAVNAGKHAPGEIADRERGLVIDEQRVESFGLSAEAEAQLAAVLRDGGEGEKRKTENDTKEFAAADHAVTSSFDNSSWKDVMTTMSRSSGTRRQGSSRNEIRPSSSRSRLPQEGSGSATPRPRIPRLASLRMKTGIEIQNCAYRIGFRLGRTCTRKSRGPCKPEA